MRMTITGALAVLALAFPPLAAGQSNKLSPEDGRYFREMAQANLAEVQAGKLAQERARHAEVKKYGEHMVEDHSKMLEQQRSLAREKGVDMPKAPNRAQQAAMKKLQDAEGERFDRAYMAQMVKDHEKTLQLVQKAAKDAKDPQLKAMAQKAAPDIKEHLQMAKQISDQAAAGATAQQRGKDKHGKDKDR